MKCSVFIATSADGYIAGEDGGVEWLETAGNSNVDMGEHADMGFADYIAGVDCMIMGRKCMEKIACFNLTPEQWPYGDRRIIVLSRTLTKVPDNLKGKVELYCGDIPVLISQLKKEGYQHLYIDGGVTITSFFNLELVDEITITRAPVLLGKGKPLFGKINKQIKLENAQAQAYANDFIQIKYRVNYL